MNLYIVLIIDPECYIDIEICFSEIQAENTILDYKRWPGYADYTYQIKEVYVDDIVEVK